MIKRPSKYKNVKVEADGLKFDSQAEHRRYCQLKLMLRAGLISDLRLQVAFELVPGVMLAGRKQPARKYIADFVYIENGITIVEDVKGMKTDMYRYKRHQMMAVHGIEIREVP